MGKGMSDVWEYWWNTRQKALEAILGPASDMVYHGVIPFDLGPDAGGAADVLHFPNCAGGSAFVTSELIGRDDQVENDLGNYELMICHREKHDWGPNVISRLAGFTCQALVNPGQTMDIGEVTPSGSTISAFLFQEYARLVVEGRACGILLCIGITREELELCRQGRAAEVTEALRLNGVHPFTDLERPSVV